MTALTGVFGGGSRQRGQPESPRRSGLRTGPEGHIEPFQGVPMNTPKHSLPVTSAVADVPAESFKNEMTRIAEHIRNTYSRDMSPYMVGMQRDRQDASPPSQTIAMFAEQQTQAGMQTLQLILQNCSQPSSSPDLMNFEQELSSWYKTPCYVLGGTNIH